MARVKVDPRKTQDRLSQVSKWLLEQSTQGDSYAYVAGYLQASLANALDLLPVGKRQEFLDRMERNTKPKTRKVRSLMTGAEIEIPYDTPSCCDPSTETYWSM